MRVTEETTSLAPPPPPALRSKPRLAIQDVSAWILRVGVVSSVAVMLLGVVVRFSQKVPSVARMQSARFDDHLSVLAQGVAAGQGRSIIEVGILLLVLTPILRVATSMVLFLAEERDLFYTLVTLAVLGLTLLSLLVLR